MLIVVVEVVWTLHVVYTPNNAKKHQ